MTVNIKSERSYGLIGSILVVLGGFLGIIPYVGMITGTISLIGQILILISLKGIGGKLNDSRPFRYYLYSMIAGIMGLILAIIFAVIGAVSIPAFVDEADALSTAGITFLVLAILTVIAAVIVGIYYAIKTWRVMYEITGVEEFNKTATFMLWGIILAIILVGLILLIVAAIYQILAFSNLPEEIEERSEMTAAQ